MAICKNKRLSKGMVKRKKSSTPWAEKTGSTSKPRSRSTQSPSEKPVLPRLPGPESRVSSSREEWLESPWPTSKTTVTTSPGERSSFRSKTSSIVSHGLHSNAWTWPETSSAPSFASDSPWKSPSVRSRPWTEPSWESLLSASPRSTKIRSENLLRQKAS